MSGRRGRCARRSAGGEKRKKRKGANVTKEKSERNGDERPSTARKRDGRGRDERRIGDDRLSAGKKKDGK